MERIQLSEDVFLHHSEEGYFILDESSNPPITVLEAPYERFLTDLLFLESFLGCLFQYIKTNPSIKNDLLTVMKDITSNRKG